MTAQIIYNLVFGLVVIGYILFLYTMKNRG